MEVAAKLKGARLSAQKARLVADQVRGKAVEEALNILTFSPKKARSVIKKALESAIANAEHNQGLDVDELRVSTIVSTKARRSSALSRALKVVPTVFSSARATSPSRSPTSRRCSDGS